MRAGQGMPAVNAQKPDAKDLIIKENQAFAHALETVKSVLKKGEGDPEFKKQIIEALKGSIYSRRKDEFGAHLCEMGISPDHKTDGAKLKNYECYLRDIGAVAQKSGVACHEEKGHAVPNIAGTNSMVSVAWNVIFSELSEQIQEPSTRSAYLQSVNDLVEDELQQWVKQNGENISVLDLHSEYAQVANKHFDNIVAEHVAQAKINTTTRDAAIRYRSPGS